MKNKSFLKSLCVAFSGIFHVIKNERNMKIHTAAAAVVLALGIYYQLSKVEFAVIFITIALVMACEMINSAIENIVDSVYKEYHQTARIIKDVAAGAVLIAAIFSVIVGYFIFFDRLVGSFKCIIEGIF